MPRASNRNQWSIDPYGEHGTRVSSFDAVRRTWMNRADWLSPERLGAWLTKQGYSGRADPAVLHARLTAAPRGITGPTPSPRLT